MKVDAESDEEEEMRVGFELAYEVFRHLPLDRSYIEFGHDNG